MRSARKNQAAFANRARRGFTLAEVLAALAFMAIVIPVAMEGIQVASRSGQIAVRKTVAMRIAERMLNESVLTSQTKLPSQTGSVQDHGLTYRWSIQTQTWPEDAMRIVTATVRFPVQGEDCLVTLSTLIGTTTQ